MTYLESLQMYTSVNASGVWPRDLRYICQCLEVFHKLFKQLTHLQIDRYHNTVTFAKMCLVLAVQGIHLQ